MSNIPATRTLATTILDASGITTMYGGPGSGKTTATASIISAALAEGREVVFIDLTHGGSGAVAFRDNPGVQVITQAPRIGEFLATLLATLQADRAKAGTYPLVIVENLDTVARRAPELLQLVKDAATCGRPGLSMVVVMESPDAAVGPLHRNSVTLARVGGSITERDARCAFPYGLGPIAHAIHEDLARNRTARVAVVQTHHMSAPEGATF